jgi:leucyl aminopeptidase
VLIDITWDPPAGGGGGGGAAPPLLALVGKGVVFDTGGLNLKTAAGMKVCDGGFRGQRLWR